MKEMVDLFIPKLNENKFLTVRRSSLDKTFGGMLALPGGGIEGGESIKETAEREFWEETGTKLASCDEKPSLTSETTLLGQDVKIFVVEGEISTETFKPIDKDVVEVLWSSPNEFIESLKEFGYPQKEIDKFTDFIKGKGLKV